MSDILDQVEAAAAIRPIGQTDIELQSAANLAKTIAEAQKARADAHNQVKQIHLERLKSWSTLLVPIVSLLTLLATIIVQSIQLHQQLQATTRQSEDVEWHDLISSLRGPITSYASDITVSSRLKTFLNSERYAEQARDLAIRVMGNLTNFGSFKELFNAVVTNGQNNNLRTTLDITRALTTTLRALESNCHTEAVALSVPQEFYFGICESNFSDVDVANWVKTAHNPNSLLQLRNSYLAVLDELDFAGQLVSEILRKAYAVQNTKRPTGTIDLSYIVLRNVDLSNIDFSSFDMTNTKLLFAQLNRSVIAPRKLTGIDLVDSEWWNATMIDKDLLHWLIDNRFPYYSNFIQVYPQGDITMEDFQTRIKSLCTFEDGFCKPPFKFGTRAEAPHVGLAPLRP